MVQVLDEMCQPSISVDGVQNTDDDGFVVPGRGGVAIEAVVQEVLLPQNEVEVIDGRNGKSAHEVFAENPQRHGLTQGQSHMLKTEELGMQSGKRGAGAWRRGRRGGWLSVVHHHRGCDFASNSRGVGASFISADRGRGEILLPNARSYKASLIRAEDEEEAFQLAVQVLDEMCQPSISVDGVQNREGNDQEFAELLGSM